MRWLFLLVLCLNLAYIAWEMSKSPNSYVDVPALKDVQPIVLLSELKQPAQPRSISAEQAALMQDEKAVADSAENVPDENAALVKQDDTKEVAVAKQQVAVVKEKPVEQQKQLVDSSKTTDVIEVVPANQSQEARQGSSGSRQRHRQQAVIPWGRFVIWTICGG